jgi:signal transduction histidine kinase
MVSIQPLKVIKVLMLEDQEDDANLVKRALRKGGFEFEALRVDDRETFIQAIDEFKPDVILSDHALPQFNSIEALKVRKEKLPDAPFILVTGAVSDEFAAQCIKLGADDYILKSNLSRLPASVKNAIEFHQLEINRVHDAAALRDQNARLLKANREIDSFVYSVSHNLRSPLASVLGLCNIARHEMHESEFDAGHYFGLIEHSIQKLDLTIKEILEYSRNERTEINPERINFHNLVNDCLERIQYLPGYSRMEKTVSIVDKVPFYSDTYRLTIILSNLFSNSVKFLDENKNPNRLSITISTNETTAHIEIMDNGMGIHPKYQPNIFNMFYRGNEKSDGAGLGLYVAREMVKKLNGTIFFTSEHALQTTFTMSIPNITK